MSVSTSLATSAAPITFTGLSSGIDTSSIISKLISIDQQPITELQDQETTIENQQSAYSQLAQELQALAQSATTLSTPSTFNAVTASSSDTSVASITSTSTATAGSYALTVNDLAQAEKISSGAQASTTSALGLSGVIVVNGQSLTVSASDTLTSLASNINGLNAGVTASVINGGQGNAYLTLTSNNTGVANAIQLADDSGSVLQSLGITNGTTAIRSPITNGAQSYALSSSTASLESILGSDGSGAGTITINGTSVSIDPSTDSLQTIANSINSDVSGVTASVQTVTNSDGSTGYQLQIVGSSSTPTIVDNNHILESIGVVQQGISSVLTKAQDASYSLDNVNLTSSSNTITSAIPGVTLTLLQGTPTSPGTSTLSLSQNTSGIASSLQSFVSAYNSVTSFISANNTYNATSGATGELFGDPIAEQVTNSLNSIMFQNVSGLSGQYQNLAEIGFGEDQSGNLTLNSTELQSALAANPTAVANLFESLGTTSSSALSYVTSSGQTVPTTTNPYEVNITQVATKQSVVAASAQTSNDPNEETLTFNGALFNNNALTLNLNIGTSLAQTVSQINSDASLNGLIYASDNNGSLEIDSKVYGSSGNFSVVSNLAAASNNSGIGTSGQATVTAGLDVAGTINGEAATGQGQFLTGNTGNATTAGLDVQYTGSTTGNVGTISFSQGLAGSLNTMLGNFSNSTNGILATANQSLQNQITQMNTQISVLQSGLTQEQATLTQEFTDMETAMAQYQSEGSELTQFFGTGSSSSSSSSSGSSSSSS